MRILFIGPALLAAAVPVSAVAQTAPAAAPLQASPFGAAAPVDNAQLGAVTGQSDLSQVIRAQNTSTVSGNSVNGHSETGTISFDPNSFQNLNGLSLLSANTGNNVSINSSLNVNVAINQ
ncbi:hypothetical protein F4693_002396 [Sphingomonas endophytica]|jgi:hypothetical protein|uniref:Uncharacterized protein n=1 Tax=Sphingomonas endophytica TaxID=869719 RepID=A0A7X0JD36_9SPHN|nr:hypothetical protein [Sphingomonas endophytica]MBB6505408.1 hypothetical protein [Sphingomonas endophytica]